MKSYRYLFLSCLLLLPWVCFAQSQDWIPVTPADLQIKEVPGEPGASAIQLFYADYRDDDNKSQFIYRRIKILTEEGRKYANIEIPVLPPYTFGALKARTIHPDGTIVDFTGKPFEKIISRTSEAKFIGQTFSMPDVTLGSIIEYKYRLEWERYTYDTSWSIQHDLFTVKQHFYLKNYSKQLVTKHPLSGEGTRLSYVVHGDIPMPKRMSNGAIDLELENTQAFKSEEYAPPVGDLKPSVRFFYGGGEVTSAEAFWQDSGRTWFEQSEHFIGNHDVLRNAAAQVIATETDPGKKLRLLYARAQRTRNLSFERRRTKQEDKKEDLKQNENAGDVLERGYGTHNDIARLFVALARGAGFDAQIVRAPNRSSYFFKSSYLVASQLAAELAVVKLNGTDLFLDPGTEFCPFGLIRWINTADRGLRLEKAGGTFVTVPPSSADKSQLRRTANGAITVDGSLKGTIDVEWQGHGALENRIRSLQEDDAGRRKMLEDEAKAWLPGGAAVAMESAEGWDTSDTPLHVRYKVDIPGFASVVGKRLLVPAALFATSRQKRAFQQAERKYPVYFPFAYVELDKLNFQMPEGFYAESVPSAQDVKLESTRFTTRRNFASHQFVSERLLVINGIIFPVSDYAQLKGFFEKLGATDEEQLVLQNAAVSASQ